MDQIISDARFKHIQRDPKYARIRKVDRKVKIDKRFEGMFKDKKFEIKHADKRGRPLNQKVYESTSHLKKFYDISSDSEDDESDEVSVSSVCEKIVKNKNVDNARPREKDKTKRKNTLEQLSFVKDASDFSDIDSKYNECSVNSTNTDLLHIKSKQDQSIDHELDNVSLDNNVDQIAHEKHFKLDLDEDNVESQANEQDKSGKLTTKIKEKLKNLNVNYARGEGVLLTDSSSEEESVEDSDDEEEIEHKWGELDKEAETTDEITNRLAICNMDWDRIRAVDLMILLNSFLPNGGLLRSVTIYPSEYGRQRMKEEEMAGPIELKNEDIHNEDEHTEDNEEGMMYHMEKLRQYQLNRLKYYYAVAEFDSPETANKVYTECDGIEYESTATKLDLRFIPDDMVFDEEAKELCNKIPEPTKYHPRQFTTTALQQVKVELTWDETNLDRQEFTQKLNSGKLQDVDKSDLQTYLASASEDDSETEEKKIDVTDDEANDNLESKGNNSSIVKYKSLLMAIEEEEEAKRNKEVELEFTWGLGNKEKVEKLVKEKLKKNEELTPFEQYLEKRKAKRKAKRAERNKLEEADQERDSADSLPSDIDMNDKYFTEEFENSKLLSQTSKKQYKQDNDIDSSNEQEENRRKAELELLLMDKDHDDGRKHFNMKEIEENATLSKSKRKRLSKKRDTQKEIKEDDFEVNVKDPRFAALYTSHNFNIDPADSHYRKTKGTEALINEKLKRRIDNETETKEDTSLKKSKTDRTLPTELQALVKSIKRKTQNITQPIR